MRLKQDILHEEVIFWRTQLSETNVRPDSSVYQRMVMALELAEYRLNALQDKSGLVVH